MRPTTSSTGIDPLSPREGNERDPAADISREAWAATFLATVRQEVLRCVDEPSLEHGGGQGANDVALTAKSDALDGSPDEAALAASSDEVSEAETGHSSTADDRIEFEFDGGQLGRLSLGIVRRNGALEVVVGVEDLRQLALIDLERSALAAALKSAGLNIASVSIARRDQAGIPFAQPRRGTNMKPQGTASDAYRSGRMRQDSDADPGLNLVG